MTVATSGSLGHVASCALQTTMLRSERMFVEICFYEPSQISALACEYN